MKKYFPFLCSMAFMFSSLPGVAQKYKTAEDTAKLNKEYVNITNDIVDLNAKLQIAQNDLPGYQSKARDANSDAVNAASASSDQASKATSGSVSDAKTAKRKANKAYNEAKDSRSAKGKVSDQENKITRYKLDIKKKQQRLEELDVMRIAIDTKIASDSIPQPQQ